MLIIGLGHKARQGKNTAALAMLNACPLDCDVRMVAFADALRREVEKATRQAGGVAELIAGFQGAGLMPAWVVPEAYPAKQRTLLQWWGSDYRRSQDEAYWADRLFSNLATFKPDVAIVTDVRFPNEARVIKAAGGVVVRVSRTTPPDIIVPEHASERALEGFTGWDYELRASDVPELKRKAADLYAEIVRRHDQGRT